LSFRETSRWRAEFVLSALLAVTFAAGCGRGSERARREESRTAATEVQRFPVAPAAHAVPPPGARSDEGDVEPPPPYFAELQRRALELATQPARPRRLVQLPDSLKAIDYDAYRSIRFRPEQSLWRNEPGNFEVQFFHPGFYYGDAVNIWQLRPDESQAQPIAFSRDWFNYGQVPPPPAQAALAFTGFRIHAPINTPEYKDEVVVFQGASYFRPLGKGNVYGLSARALAIDLGEPTGEEFPRFTEFYLMHPRANDRAMWVLGLLESERAAGAFAFLVRPGAPTSIEVTAELFLRGTPHVIGLSPLSSMYLFGEESPGRFGDFRPEVHDSDGVLLGSKGGEWLFRPLTNPKRTRVTSLRLDEPVGFGLLQRDRRFESYQDLEARHEDRPSVWIEPVSGFHKGSLRLLEIATRLETDDNIAVAWVPDDTSAEQLSLRYRMRVGSNVGQLHAGGTVAATRLLPEKGNVRFLVDFAGKQLIDKQTQAVVSAQGGRVLEQHVENNPHLPGVRASFLIQPAPEARDVELRAFLQRSGDALTETWSYLWQDKD
jgi:glucans biosynthesis protein